MPQIKVKDSNTGKIFSIDYEDDDNIQVLKTFLESRGYEPGMELYYDDNISSGNVLQDVVDISTLNEPDKPLVVVGDTKSAPASAPEPEPERPPEPEPETVPTTQDELTKLSSKIQKLQEMLKHMEATRIYLEREGEGVDGINLEIGLIKSKITQLQKQADSMFEGGGKRRRRGRRKPTKSRKTKRTRKRRSLKRQSLKKRSRKRRSFKRRSRK